MKMCKLIATLTVLKVFQDSLCKGLPVAWLQGHVQL